MKTTYWLPLLAVILCSCTRNDYDIELNRVGNSLERKLTLRQQTRGESDAPTAFDDEVKRISKEYHVPPPAPGKAHVFRGSFTGRMPSDVGAYGTFAHWDKHGQPLLDYCIWYHGLTAGEREEWASFVDGLRPDSELDKALKGFRFSHEPDGRDKDQHLASAPVAAILKGLKERR